MAPLKKGIAMSGGSQINALIAELDQQYGERLFFTVDELVNCGIFGSKGTARLALRHGLIASFRVSERRRVVPRQELIKFISAHLDAENNAGERE